MASIDPTQKLSIHSLEGPRVVTAMFNPKEVGTPVRATCHVTIREANRLSVRK